MLSALKPMFARVTKYYLKGTAYESLTEGFFFNIRDRTKTFPVVATVLHESGSPRNPQEEKSIVLNGNEDRTNVS